MLVRGVAFEQAAEILAQVTAGVLSGSTVWRLAGWSSMESPVVRAPRRAIRPPRQDPEAWLQARVPFLRGPLATHPTLPPPPP